MTKPTEVAEKPPFNAGNKVIRGAMTDCSASIILIESFWKGYGYAVAAE